MRICNSIYIQYSTNHPSYNTLNIKLTDLKSIIFIFALSLLILSCSSTPKTAERLANKANASIGIERDWTSFEKAIVIQAKSESVGIRAKYDWIRQNYPGYKISGQALCRQNKKSFDIISIVTAEGEEISLYFDISGFYGKY